MNLEPTVAKAVRGRQKLRVLDDHLHDVLVEMSLSCELRDVVEDEDVHDQALLYSLSIAVSMFIFRTLP